jgi:hypothetical protein
MTSFERRASDRVRARTAARDTPGELPTSLNVAAIL